MAQTQIRTKQILDSGITRADINTSTSGNAIITKIIKGTSVDFTSTGADAGTGDVTVFLEAIANNSFLGNISGSSASPIGLTATQVTAVLDSFTGSIKALVPASAGGTTNFLRADGQWAAPSGGSGLPSLTGTANQVLVNSTSGSAVTTAATLTLPQSIATTSDVQFGTTTIAKDWGAPSSTNLITRFDSYGDPSRVTIRAANGTIASPTGLTNGQVIGNINFRGYHSGGAFPTGGLCAISASAAENFTSSAMGTILTFANSKIGELIGSERMRLHSNGYVGVNNTNPDSQLHVTSSDNSVNALKVAATASSSVPAAIFDAPSGIAPIKFTNLTQTSSDMSGSVKILVVNAAGDVGVSSGSGSGVSTITGTANQILANGSTSAQTGGVTLTLPQNISTGSDVQFLKIGLGVAPATSPITIFNSVGGPLEAQGDVANSYSATITQYGSGVVHGSGLLLRSSGGTYASPANVLSGDRLGFVVFGGYAGGAFRNTAAINAMVGTGTISGTSLPTYIQFLTTPDGSVSRTERMRIDQDGNIVIGTTSAPSTGLYQEKSGDSSRIRLRSYGGLGILFSEKANGTVSSPTTITTGNLLFILGVGGYDGTAFKSNSTGGLRVLASQDWTSGAHGSYLTLDTTADGATSNSERVRVSQNGKVGINTQSPSNILHVVSSSDSEEAFKAEATGSSTVAAAVFTAPVGVPPIKFTNLTQTSSDMSGSVKSLVVNASGEVGVASSGGASIVTGNASVNFGSAPGSSYEKVTVSDGAASSSRRIVARVSGSTASHNFLEHMIVPFKVAITNIVNATSFDIEVFSEYRLTGTFNCQYEII